MKEKDKRGSFLGRFNSLDWLIIVLVVVIIGGAYFGLNYRSKSLAVPQMPISYDLEIKAVGSDFMDNAKAGSLIYESTKGNKMGKVTKVDVKPAESINQDTVNGKFVLATVPNLYDVILTVETNAQVSSSSIVTDGLELKVGKKIFVKGKGFANAAFVMAIRLNK